MSTEIALLTILIAGSGLVMIFASIIGDQ